MPVPLNIGKSSSKSFQLPTQNSVFILWSKNACETNYQKVKTGRLALTIEKFEAGNKK